jgi:hypothetical protein
MWTARSIRADIQRASWSDTLARLLPLLLPFLIPLASPRPALLSAKRLYVTHITDGWQKTGQKSAE